ncbi:glycoside hydrolase family 3 N-terminal domain-containing protein [Saccharicrinis sp. 156]|uniref:glycoside hydrolase family 3 N-terminal domain-containing protein n=1 Tax=Saccharicrinis sp. 156 TaxID=3417574 RepID=UPI003D328567
MNLKSIIGLLIVLLGLGACNNFHPNDYKNSNLSDAQRAENLLSQLNLQEKISQMRIFHSGNRIHLNKEGELDVNDEAKEYIENGIAGIKNAGTAYDPKQGAILCNKLQKYIIEHNRFGIPAMFIIECYNGVEAKGNTHFSRPLTMASSFNTELVKQLWDALGREARIRGLHMCHSPEADLVRDPRFGRMTETFGEDPYLTSRMVVSAVKGVQGHNLGLKSTHIGAVTKHFAGYAQVQGGKNFASMQMSPRSFVDEILPPFKAAVKEAKTLGIMASHADINGVASHANRKLLTDTLKNYWGFDGYVVSDATDIERLHHFMKVAESFEAAAEMALKAGMDIDLYGNDGYALLENMVEDKPELLELIDDAVRRVLLTKFKLGLFDNPYVDVSLAQQKTRTKETLDLALEVDLESIILLKNENRTLPMHPMAYKHIAVIGPNADKENITAIKNQLPEGVKVSYAKGCGISKPVRMPTLYSLEEDKPLIKEAVQLAKKADVVLLFVGGDHKTAKEAYFVSDEYGDRAELNPVGQQNLLLEELKKTGKKVVVILEHRRTLSIVDMAEKADAIIDCWDLSERGKEAIAKILFGEVNPSGKLTVTVPQSVGQLPAYYYQKHINYKKGYLFAKNQPLFPFGFGLSYTQFRYSNLSISDTIVGIGDSVQVSVDITNVGDVAGKEVCQIYLQDEYATVLQPIRALKGFEKVTLKPGETQTIKFNITPDNMSFTGIDMQQKVEAGRFNVFVGGSSDTDQMLSYNLRE